MTAHANTPSRPRIVCHMISSVDGRLLPDRWTASPDGDADTWIALYDEIYAGMHADGWIVGRVTMAEMAEAQAHPPATIETVDRPLHVAARRGPFAIAIDPSGKLHFDGPDLSGDHVVVVLGRDVPDAHLAELAKDGVSYVVASGDEIDLAAVLEILAREFAITTLALEGGAGINGTFFSAGLVDELSVVLAPTLDGASGVRAIVDSGDHGLQGTIELAFTACEPLAHGALHLRYAVRRSVEKA